MHEIYLPTNRVKGFVDFSRTTRPFQWNAVMPAVKKDIEDFLNKNGLYKDKVSIVGIDK